MRKMIEKDPLSYEALTYAWVLIISFWGGISSYIRRFRQAGKKVFSVPELVGELCISGFVGVITFYLCEASGLNQVISAAMIGITGHMGSRAIFLFERSIEAFIIKKTGFKNNDDRAD